MIPKLLTPAELDEINQWAHDDDQCTCCSSGRRLIAHVVAKDICEKNFMAAERKIKDEMIAQSKRIAQTCEEMATRSSKLFRDVQSISARVEKRILEAKADGLDQAAKMQLEGWNDPTHMVNQRNQALRWVEIYSREAAVLRKTAEQEGKP